MTWPPDPAEKPLGLLPAGWARGARVRSQEVEEGKETGEGNPWENWEARDPQEREEKRAEEGLEKDNLPMAFLFQSGGPGSGQVDRQTRANEACLVCLAATGS